MPAKTWEPPPAQHDRERQLAGRETDEPRNFEARGAATDANQDAPRDTSEYEDINTHGSER